MPFKSEAQRRLFWAKVNRGEIAKSKAEEWEHETKDKNLPEHVKKKASAAKKASAILNCSYRLGAQHALGTLGCTLKEIKK